VARVTCSAKNVITRVIGYTTVRSSSNRNVESTFEYL